MAPPGGQKRCYLRNRPRPICRDRPKVSSAEIGLPICPPHDEIPRLKTFGVDWTCPKSRRPISVFRRRTVGTDGPHVPTTFGPIRQGRSAVIAKRSVEKKNIFSFLAPVKNFPAERRFDFARKRRRTVSWTKRTRSGRPTSNGNGAACDRSFSFGAP